ncbi:MAG: transcriptional regulator with domain and aminotransferase domain [Rariglobus sp.]|jgi:DNA-binding transcriptional MocR family regulator|nr:transcriptional regulator with domain and aminotransferase domain [Rariglobus sp.]
MTDYRALADSLATDIAQGRLAPGHRLPPQREFAWSRKIAVSTASRVYAELVRRGLVTGEVGRGTYVAAPAGEPSAALTEPRGPLVDLEYNFPRVQGQEALLAQSISALLRPDVFARAVSPLPAAGTPEARKAVAHFLSRPAWPIEPDSLLFSGNGRQALAAAFASACGPGGVIAVEPLTYAVVKGIAARLAITLVPVATDAHGLRADALARLHRERKFDAVYLQPTLHNPLGTTMPPRRRREIADLARVENLLLIEDGIYSFLSDATPLAALAPDQVVFIDSLSKRLSPGLTLGMLVVPPAHLKKMTAALRSGGWTAQRFALEAAVRWLTDGTARKITRLKRQDAVKKQALARACLKGHVVRGDPASYHLWLELGATWRAETFVNAAAEQGVAITAGAAFAVQPGHVPRAVRLALGGPSPRQLKPALLALAALLNSPRKKNA